LISLLREIEESGHFALRFQALLDALRGLTTVLPNVALPANSELSSICRKELERVTTPLTGETAVKVIEEAGKTAVRLVEAPFQQNGPGGARYSPEGCGGSGPLEALSNTGINIAVNVRLPGAALKRPVPRVI
jgi:hypothetical protein